MQVVSGFFFIMFLAAAFGVIKPYISHLNRWQFAVIAIVSFLICGALQAGAEQGIAMVFFVAFGAAALGVIKPFTKRVTRWQFVAATVVSFIMFGATANTTKMQDGGQSSPRVADADEAKKATAPASGMNGATASEAEPSEQPRPTSSGKAEADPLADKSDQHLWIVKSQDAIKSRLRDPGSADFRNSRFYSGGPAPVVCGEVNAKNAFGGYTGFQRFIASGDNPNMAFLATDVASGDSINEAWDQLCIAAERDEAFVP